MALKIYCVRLDTLHLKEETLLAYEAFKTFEKIMQPHMLITDYKIKFGRL